MDYRKRTEAPLKHLFDGMYFNVYEKNVVNLSAGVPSENLLKDCCELFKKATDHRLKFESEENSSYLFTYGPTDGTQIFRTNLAEFLTAGYQETVYSSDLCLTAGATNGLHLILSTLVDLDGYVFLDEVTYMIALEAISEFSSLKIIPVKLNDDGVDLVDLEEKLKEKQFKSNPKKIFWGIYYTIPTYHNPTGILFSEEVNTGLIKLARKYDILIACDDVYNLLAYDDEKPPKRLFAYDSFEDEDFRGNVISNGTFSKILAPGVRIGWLECSPRIIKPLRESGILKSGGAINNYTSGLVASLIELKLIYDQLNKCRENYKRQRDALIDALDKTLPTCCSYVKPNGGYFVWIKLPENVDGDELCEFCLKDGKVFAIRGSRFSIENKFKNFIRLSFAFHGPEVMHDAGVRICQSMKKYFDTKNMQ